VSENLDLVRSIRERWERGDYGATDWAHPEIEFVWVDGPMPGRWSGVEGMAEGMRDFLGVWRDFRTSSDEYRELDDERVLALIHLRGRGKASGLELASIRSRAAAVFYVREGQVVRIVQYFDRDRALADLGLTE
jgi:ketosteroid isomerase-like protein